MVILVSFQKFEKDPTTQPLVIGIRDNFCHFLCYCCSYRKLGLQISNIYNMRKKNKNQKTRRKIINLGTMRLYRNQTIRADWHSKEGKREI